MSAAGKLWWASATMSAPALRVMLRVRLRRGKELPDRLTERRGIDSTPRPAGRLMWLHAASVGETASILSVLPLLLDADPGLTILFTTGTVTAAALLAQRLEPVQRRRVLQRFVPLDVPAWVARFLDHWRPDAAAFVESELWPNLIAALRARGVSLMLINARMSARSFARWRRLPGFAREMLSAFDRIQPRSEEDGARLRALGVTRLDPSGDLKFAAAPLPVDAAELEGLRQALAGRPIWLAASTHPGEDEVVFAAHRKLAERFPDVLTILAPRHPERGAAIAGFAAPVAVARRALGEAPPMRGVWIADTLGEMGLWYRLAPIAFVGRSLTTPGGGQNLLEPALLRCAILVGPHTGNFEEHVRLLREADALAVVSDAAELARTVGELLLDYDRCNGMGERAAAAVQRERDLPARTATALRALLDGTA